MVQPFANDDCVILLYRESLYEDEEFDQRQRQLAALLVSKVITIFFSLLFMIFTKSVAYCFHKMNFFLVTIVVATGLGSQERKEIRIIQLFLVLWLIFCLGYRYRSPKNYHTFLLVFDTTECILFNKDNHTTQNVDTLDISLT